MRKLNLKSENSLFLAEDTFDNNSIALSNKTQIWRKSKSDLSSEEVVVDSLGNKLTAEQAEYFKNSYILDEKDNLLVLYRGTSNRKGRTEFLGTIKWLTPSKEYAVEFANSYGNSSKVYEVYANCSHIFDCGSTDGNVFKLFPITKPLKFSNDFTNLMSKLDLDVVEANKLVNAIATKNKLTNEEYYKLKIFSIVRTDEFAQILKTRNYDCVRTIEFGNECFGVFDSKNIKNVNNRKPTSKPGLDESNDVKREGEQMKVKSDEYKLIKDEIYRLCHIRDVEGEDVPYYCFLHDITDNFGLDAKSVMKLAKQLGYRIMKVYSEKDEIDSEILIVDKECLPELIEKDYLNFYEVDVKVTPLGMNSFNSVKNQHQQEEETKDNIVDNRETSIKAITRESLKEAFNNDVKVYETTKDGLPEVGRKFIAYRTTHKEYEIYIRQDKEAIRKKGWSDIDSHISKDGEFYSGNSGWIYPVDYDRYVYVDELKLISPETDEKDRVKQENATKTIKTAFNEVFVTFGDKLAAAFTIKNKKGNVEIEFPFTLREDNSLDINYLVFENESKMTSRLIEPMRANNLSDNDIVKIFNIIFSYNWKNYYTKNKLVNYKQKALDNIAKLNSAEVKEGLQKEEDVVYKGFTITHSPTTWYFGDKSYDVDGYIILSNYSLDKEGKHRLPLYCEDENHKVLNFNTLQEAKNWIDKYEGKFSVKVLHGGEVHAVINEVSDDKAIEEAIEKHNELNPLLWNEDNSLKEEVKEKLLEIVNTFITDLQEDEVKINVDDVILVGSNCSYNYNDKSDLDLHIRANTESLECPDNLYPLLYSAYRSIFSKKYDISFYGVPVELYVETEESTVNSNGIYSLYNGWIKEPVQQDIPELDEKAFESEFAIWEDKYFNLIDSKNAESLSSESVEDFIEDIYELRKSSIAGEGEYSIGNLVFKEMRALGYLDELKDLKNELKSKELSLESLKEDVEPAAMVEPLDEPEDEEEVDTIKKDRVPANKVSFFSQSFRKNAHLLFPNTDYENLYISKDGYIEAIPQEYLKNKFSASCEQAREDVLMSKDELLKLKDKYNALYVVFFLAKDSKWGGEYSFILDSESIAKEICDVYKQDGYACYDDKGAYVCTKDVSGNIVENYKKFNKGRKVA